MNIEKDDEFIFLDEEGLEFMSRCSQSLVNTRSEVLVTWRKKLLILFMRHNQIIYIQFLFQHGDVLLVWVKYIIKYVHICIKVFMREVIVVINNKQILKKVVAFVATVYVGVQ